MSKKADSKSRGRSDHGYTDIKDDLRDYKRSESKSEEKCYGDDEIIDGQDNYAQFDYPKVEVQRLEIDAAHAEVSAPIKLKLTFSLDRDVVAGFWEIKFLVDSANHRIIKILGETPVEDYPDGESEMEFYADNIDVSGIAPSVLTNCGLLIASFKVHGEEVATVNMVVNITKKKDKFFREILSPLD